MGQFDDIFGVKTPDDSGVAVSGEYDDIFGIKPQRTLKTNLQDAAATAAKGITGLSDAAIGLANIPTMGQAGRSAQLVGLNEVYDDPMQAEQALQEHQQNIAAGKRNEFLDASPYSAPQQHAQKQVTDAEGVLGKLGAAVRNPSTIATAVGESVPSMLAGGLIGRGLAVGTKLSPVVAGAIGEGVVGAGAAAEQTRKESPTGTLTPQQTAMAVGSGVGTGIFGYVGGKVANKLGFDDADTLIANGFQRVAKKSAAGGAEVAEKGFAQNAAEVAGRIVGGGISEGAFEELPQSIQETMWQNAATGKPLTEGMDEAAVMGFLSGVAMGGPVNALPRPNAQSSPGNPQESPAPPQANPASPDQPPFPTQEPPPPYTETVPGPETLQPPAPPVPTPGPISRAADMLARTTPGIMGKVMDPAMAPLPEDNLAGEWNAQEQQAMAGNQARNFTRAEQAAYELEQQRQAQQAEARRQADPLAAQKAAFEESYNAMGTVPESMGNITPDDAAAFERKVEFERATNRRQQYIKAWKQAEQEADTLTRDPEIPAEVKREARKQVREIVKADPVYEQMNEVKRRGGLNLEAMGQDYDRDTVNIINRRYPGIFSRVGSVKPDDFANEMGYDDLDAMVRRFSEARTQKELTASILKEKTGDWQNAESEQQAYASKQAERKQGAEWAGAQGADRVSRGIPARTVFPAPDEAVSAMESMIRRKPENFREEDFDHWTYTAEQQGRLKQAYREAAAPVPAEQATLPRNISATQPAERTGGTDAFLQGQRERREFSRGEPATSEGDAQGFLRDQQGRQSFQGVDNTPQTVAANPDGFLRDQGIRRDAVGKVSEPMRRQPGESTRDFIKRRKAGREAGGESFDVGHASDAAYNQPQNAAIREAWTRAHMVQDSDGTARRMQHDHFDEWHAGGGVSSAVGSQYDAHGIAKSNPLGALLNLLQNGIDTTRRFDTAPLVTNSGTSAGLGAASGAYKDGPFIILGKKGKELKEGIHTVLVSDAVSDVIPQLQQRFQGVRFVKYSEAQATLENDSANVSPNPNDEPQADLSSTGETQASAISDKTKRLIDQETKKIVSDGGQVHSFTNGGKQYYVEIDPVYGWKGRGQSSTLRDENWNVVGSNPSNKEKSKKALVSWAESLIASKNATTTPSAKPAQTSDKAGAVKGKEPWEMTREAYGVPKEPVDVQVPFYPNLERIAKTAPKKLTAADNAILAEQKKLKAQRHKYLRDHREFLPRHNEHYAAVRGALAEGKPVPAAVLADYPDLAKQYGKQLAQPTPKNNSTSDLPSVGTETAPSKGAASNQSENPTVKESLTVQPQTSTQGESDGVEVETKVENIPQWAENHAKEVGGKVVYHDNEVALIEGFSMTGKLVYSGVSKKRDARTRVGIGTYTGGLFTSEQKQRLVDTETNARKIDEKLHLANPNGPFLGKGKFATSENTPTWAAEFTENLIKMLGVDSRVYLTTMDDAKSATNFHGPFAAIRSASVTSDRTLAETRQLPNGDMYIVFRPTSGKTLLLETLAHEVGHIVEKTAWKEATDSERAAVLEDFRAWRDRKGIPAREWVNSMRALRSARNTTVPAGVGSDDMTQYWKSFSEYFADQVSRWAVSSDKPLSVVERFFKKIAVNLRKIYASLAGKRFLPAASMRAYLDKRSAAFIPMRDGEGADISLGATSAKLSKASQPPAQAASTPADIRAEVSAKLGKFRTMQLMRRGVLNVVATQEEAEADIQNKEDAFRSEQTGAIQGYAKNGKVTLVADGIPSGNAYQVFLHEITHATRLGLNSNASFKRLLDTIERHKGQDTALGEAITAAEARIPADTKPEHRTEEILSYFIEMDRADVGIVRRFIAMVKKVLVNMGVSPDIFSKEDFKALAVNAAKWQSTMATGGNVMRSVREMFKPVDPNSPALKRWQGSSQITDPVFHGSPKEFWTFDKNRVGKNTTSPGAGIGFFFATNRAESQGYAGPSGSLRSFYVKAENPKYMNASDMPKFRGVDEAQAYAKQQQLAGYDSIVLEDEGHVIVFEPNQVKSAEINTGAFDAGNDDVRYSVAGGGSGITGNGSGPAWATPQDSKTDSFIYNAQDKLIDMKRIQDNIEKALGPIQEQHDVRMAEELYHKRAAKRVEDVLVAEVNPLMKELGAIQSADLSEFEEYMHALHAPEANESLRQRNPNEQELKALKEAAKADRDNLQQSAIVRRFIDKERELAAAERDVEAGDADDSLITVINDELESLRDEPIVGKYIKAREKHRKLRHAQPFGGDNTALSGMSNEAAEALLANMPAAKLRKYKALAAKWRRFMDKTRDTLVKYELESQETVDSWAEAFENYVPLHREDMENGMGIGQGFSVKGSATRSRTGSNRKVVDIIAHIVAQRERAIVRGEKAAISRALYGLAAANPNPDVWTIETPPVVREFDPVTGLVVSRPDPMYKNKPNAVVHRFLDDKGHVEERAVLFNEQSDRGMRLAQALKNLDTEQLGAILRTSAVLTRWFSAVNTQYNLVFGPVNAIRDAGAAMLHLTDTPLAGRQKQVAKRIATGIKPLFKAIWAEASGTPLDTDIAKAWHELQIEGGTTGFRDMFENAEERAEELKRAMLSTTKSRIAAKLSWAKQQVSQYNDVMENCARLAVYMESRDQGLSKAKSASLAKNITLNFNRKGKVASQVGAMYAFFNASMQGTEKMYRTMTGPAGKKILAGGLLLGASQAVLLAAAGFGDDEPPEFIKERALIIPVGGKKYVTIPMPLGFNIIPNVARVATEWMLSGGKDTGERVTGLIGSFAETFNPIGNAGFSVQTIAPTVIDPLVALSENKDWTGKPIAKQNFNTLKPTPGHERMKDTASAVGIGLSRLLNFLSGGTEYTPGSLSPTPDQIDYLIGQAFGGVGRESLKTAQVVGTMYTGEDLPVYKIPLVSRFYGDSADSSAASTAFYRNVKRMNVHAAEIEGLTENRGDVAGYMADHPEAKYVRRTEATYRRVQKLQKVKRTLLKNDAPRAKVEAVEKSISSLMSSYNNYVKER